MPAIDYPNDYYNDAEYYNDAYGSYNSSDENYIDVDAQVKVVFHITQEGFFYLLKKKELYVDFTSQRRQW